MGFFDSLFKKKDARPAPEIQPPATENALETALRRFAGTEISDEEFTECLVSSDIFIPVSDDYDPEKDEPLPVLMFDKDHIPVFSSESRMLDNDYFRTSGANYVRMNTLDFLENLGEETPIMLNPFSRYTTEFSLETIQRLAQGKTGSVAPVEVAAGSGLCIILPESYPDRLAEALTEMFSREPAIRRGFILLAKKDEEPTRFLIVVDYSGDLQTFISENYAPLEAVLPEGVHVDFATMEQLWQLDSLLNEAEPFYTR